MFIKTTKIIPHPIKGNSKKSLIVNMNDVSRIEQIEEDFFKIIWLSNNGETIIKDHIDGLISKLGDNTNILHS